VTAQDILQKYISFFEKRGHTRIANAPLIPQNDPTTLFTSSGMQPLVPYLLGQPHPSGKRLVNVQNAFRAVDIDEIGNNRHTTFFRMLGNWSLGDYFKKEQLPWLFTFLTNEEGLGLDPKRLYVTVFAGDTHVPKDSESVEIWKELFASSGIEARENERIFAYGAEKNWWSRAGIPEKMPVGEPGGPDSEVFYDFGQDLKIHEQSPYKDSLCHVNCDCGRFIEICNSVFMQYKKDSDGSLSELPKPNVDFGGGLERFLIATESQPDVFQTSLFLPIIETIVKITKQSYEKNKKHMRIIADHLVSAAFIIQNGIAPSNKDQGYIVRRLLRRSFDYLYELGGNDFTPILEAIITQYQETDEGLTENFEKIKLTIIEEEQKYTRSRNEAKKYIAKKYKKHGDELLGTTEISADDVFVLYTTHGLSPSQIKSLGFQFDDHSFAEKMKEHKDLSRTASAGKFKGGLADHSERTIMGHTATHLLHQALRDVLGKQVHQSGSNITSERVRFDFAYDKKLTEDEIMQVEKIVNEKIKENLPVHFEIMSQDEANKLGAIGLFIDTYGEKVKIYFIGDTTKSKKDAYSIEYCGGPHVDFTGKLKKVTIKKQESLGRGQRRIYAIVG